MFDFLFEKNKNLVSILDVITEDAAKLNASKFAVEKAVSMIGKAIAKSEIVLQDKNGRRMDEYYYRLNVRPNDNETGTDFWMKAIRKLVYMGECLICKIGDMYYIAESWQENELVMKPRQYSNIKISAAGKETTIKKRFQSDDVIHLRYQNRKIKVFMDDLLNQYDKLLTSMNTAKKLAAMPKYKLKFDAQMSLAERTSEGETRTLTREQYAEKLKKLLTADEVSLLAIPEKIDINQIKYESTISAEELLKIQDEAYRIVAMAFDIPVEVFKGTITEKSDATNEFITYAVTPIVEIINDALNAILVGEADYIAGERIFVWLAKFKHVDVVDSASNLDKLRSIGFTLDEIFELVGYPQLNTEFSRTRALTKNYESKESV